MGRGSTLVTSEKTRIKKRKVSPAQFANVYYDYGHPAGYGGARALSEAVHSTLASAREWLSTQDPYTLHRRVKRRYATENIVVAGLDDQFEADLVDVSAISSQNNGVKFLLTVIDSLSKFAWAIPVKDKRGATIAAALESVFKERKPRKLRTDRGSEFISGLVQKMLKARDITFFTANTDAKAAIVERFNRTLREKLWRYFTATGRERYVDILPSVVNAYNHRVHRTTGMAPADVNQSNAELVWRKMYGKSLLGEARGMKRTGRAKFKVGDSVRLGKSKGSFEKGYKTNWIKEVFVISKVLSRRIPRYIVQDSGGETIVGTFAQDELQKVRPVERVVKRVVKRSGDKVGVLWRGYPDKLLTCVTK